MWTSSGYATDFDCEQPGAGRPFEVTQPIAAPPRRLPVRRAPRAQNVVVFNYGEAVGVSTTPESQGLPTTPRATIVDANSEYITQ